jgi:hypothetical protein
MNFSEAMVQLLKKIFNLNFKIQYHSDMDWKEEDFSVSIKKIKESMEEIWKLVPNFSSYEVSNFGKVRETSTKMKIPIYRAKNGSLFCSLKTYPDSPLIDKKSSRWRMFIHRMVLDAFGTEAWDDEMIVTHLDGNRDNNRISNLKAIKKFASVFEMQAGLCKVVCHDLRDRRLLKFKNLSEASRATGVPIKEILWSQKNEDRVDGYEFLLGKRRKLRLKRSVMK